MRKALVTVLVLLAVLAVVVYALRAPISLAIMERAVAANMAADPVAEVPAGIHVTLCGAGGPLPDPERSGACVAVVAGGRLFVVDAGSATARNLVGMDRPPAAVDAVFLTHFHSDHIDGLGELQLQRWPAGSHDEPLPVYGPEGVEEVVNGFNRAYRLDAIYRTAHHGPEVAPPSGAGMRAESFDPPAPGESVVVYDRDGVVVTAFPVDHEPAVPAVGYRIDHAGRSLVISGDTDQSPDLERVAAGVDLLVHEALDPELMEVAHQAAKDAGRANLAKITADVLDYHATPEEAAESAEKAGAGHLLFYHVVPPLPLPGLASIFLEGVDDAYSGGFTLGRDGTTVFLPADSERIEVTP